MTNREKESVLVQAESREDGGEAKTLQSDNGGGNKVGDGLEDARSANLELVQQRRCARIDVSVRSEVSALPIASSLVRIQLPAHFRDNVGSGLPEDGVGGAVIRGNGGLGVIDDADNGTTDRSSAGGSLACIELNKGGIKLGPASAESSSDLVIGPANESGGRDSGGHGHGATREDRKDGGETHFG